MNPSNSHTVSWYKRVSVWLGIGINPASLTLGAGLAILLPLQLIILSLVLGALILTIIAVLQGITARRRGQNLGQRANQTFGSASVFLNLLLIIGMLGWGGFQVGISGASAGNMFNLPAWVGALLITLIFFTLSGSGINRWNAFGWVTTLSAMALAFFSLIITHAQPDWDLVPQAYSSAQIFYATGLGFTYAILFALRAPDFTWDLKRDADVIKSGIAFYFAFTISAVIGAILYQTTGSSTLDRILQEYQYATLGYLFLIIAVASPILSILHSATLALETIIPAPKRLHTALICVTIFILGALRFDQQLLTFLDWVGVILPPALFVMLAAFWQRGEISHRLAFIAWIAGALAALLAKLLGLQFHLIASASVSLAILFLHHLPEMVSLQVRQARLDNDPP